MSWKSIKQQWNDWTRGFRVAAGSIMVFVGALLAYQLVPTPAYVPPHTVEASGDWTLTVCQTITVANVDMIIQPGYNQWDGLSIPHCTTNGLQITRDDYALESLWHDAGYAIIDREMQGPLSKEFVDEGLRILLVSNGCSPIKAQAVKDGVDAFGFTAIRAHTDESVARARRYVKVEIR